MHDQFAKGFMMSTASNTSTKPLAANPSRSENMLPTDTDSSGDDGRFNVAEEVSLDQQSDSTRKVGQAPAGAAADALAETVKKPDAAAP